MRQRIAITLPLFAELACAIAHAGSSHAAGQRAGIQASAIDSHVTARGDCAAARGPTTLVMWGVIERRYVVRDRSS